MITDKALHTLEYDRVLGKVAGHTSFSLSKEMVLALQPCTELDEVQELQGRVAEAMRVLDSRADVSLGGAHDIRQDVTRAALGGTLDPAQLLEILGTLECAERVRGTLARLTADDYPWLVQLRTRIGTFREIIALILQTVSQQGEILDSASPALAKIRVDLRLAYQRLMDRLQSILSSQTYRNAIQEPIITMRNGRYVIPVRSDMRGVVRGAVHDHSSSGATLYVEPFQTSELNNRWRELQLQEQEEIARILRVISERIASQAPSLLTTVNALAEFDVTLAKARFGGSVHGTLPVLAADGRVDLLQARHPLLSGHVVPISVRLGDEFRQLLVTGPNTGGKTVALKTVGLLTLMAQSGIPIPAESGSRVAVFDGVFADIGDEQSIEQSLSTFSSHMNNIIRLLDELTDRSLLLLDELGAGTDPAEGSALARSLLTYLLKTPARVMATTHYSELKAFASTTDGVENASVEFDIDTLSPTFRLSIGLPGRSNALAIASRLGLRPEIIDGSREFLSSEETRVETMLAQIAHDRETAAELYAAATEAQRRASELRSRLEQEVESVLHERDSILRAARAAAEASVSDLRRELDRAEAEMRVHGSTQTVTLAALRDRVERASEHQAKALAEPANSILQAAPPSAPISDRAISVGDRIQVLRTGQDGTVSAIPPGRSDIEIQIGAFKMRAKLKDVRLVARLEDLAPVDESRYGGGTQIVRSAGPAPSLDFDMRGWRVDEVIPELERYLNDAYMSNMPFVRIIHGKGTGALRQVVREELATNPLVSSFKGADDHAGGEGVTIAHLAV